MGKVRGTSPEQRVKIYLELGGWTLLEDRGQTYLIACPRGHNQVRSLKALSSKSPWCGICPTKDSDPIVDGGIPTERLLTYLAKQGRELRGIDAENQTITARCLSCRTVRTVDVSAFERGRARCLCDGNSVRGSAGQRLLDTVAARGGELLSQDVFGVKDRYEFRCARGHTWDSTGGSVIHQNTWCPICAGNTPRTLDELRMLVEKRGGRLLSTEYVNVDSLYDFECNLGHTFTNQFKKVMKGQWCPTCNRSTKSEEIARACMEGIFGAPFPKKRPKWLRNARNRQMELDGFCEELNLAFEYQGYQHFQESTIFSPGGLEQRIGDDTKKLELCEQHGVHLFYFTHENDYDNFAEIAINQAEKFGDAVRSLVKSDSFDVNKAFIREDRILELRELLSRKNINVLSEKWITSDYRYNLECGTCGHKWRARGNAFFNSRSVAGCDQCARRVRADEQRGSMEDVRRFAQSFGGDVLSESYESAQSRYEFICAQGHVFTSRLNNMTHFKQFCPTCEKRGTRKHIDEAQASRQFAELGYELLGKFERVTKECLIRHNACGEESKKSLKRLRENPNCQLCKFREKEAETRKLWSEHFLLPLEPFPGAISKPWKSKCQKCGNVTSPTPINIIRGQGGCRGCYLQRRRRNA